MILHPPSIFHIQTGYPNGRLLPIKPRGEADPPEGAISNPDKAIPMRGEEEVARTPAIGATESGNGLNDTAQYVGQRTLLIRCTLPIDDDLKLRVSEEVVDMPVRSLFITEVTIQPGAYSPSR